MHDLIEKYRHWIVGIFFALYLLAGLLIFKDYGVHWDEYHNQEFGERWSGYIQQVLQTGSLAIPISHTRYHDLTHGPFLEICLTLLKDSLHVTDSREIILMRHLSIFLLYFMGAVIFYFLCLRHFNNWKLALLGVVLLILNPRTFSHSFYNTVDIGFLIFFTLAMFTLILFLDKKTWGHATLHALTCAIAVNIRFFGVPIVLLTAAALLMGNRHENKQEKEIGLKLLVYYLCLFALLWILFCPILWNDPCGEIGLIAKTAITDERFNSVFYLGHMFKLHALPWHYAPVWILISTPVVTSLLFIAGCIKIIKTFIHKNLEGIDNKRNSALFLLWFLVPLLLANGRLYNSWRHIFFIYPALVIIATMGFQYIWVSAKNRRLRSALIALLLINMLFVLGFMIKNHPYEDVYFNRLAGKDLGSAKANFEFSYWGNPYKQALEYILARDQSTSIPVYFYDAEPGQSNLLFLSNPDRNRFVVTDDPLNAKYSIALYKKPKDKPPEQECYSIKVNGSKIISIFQKVN